MVEMLWLIIIYNNNTQNLELIVKMNSHSVKIVHEFNINMFMDNDYKIIWQFKLDLRYTLFTKTNLKLEDYNF